MILVKMRLFIKKPFGGSQFNERIQKQIKFCATIKTTMLRDRMIKKAAESYIIPYLRLVGLTVQLKDTVVQFVKRIKFM